MDNPKMEIAVPLPDGKNDMREEASDGNSIGIDFLDARFDIKNIESRADVFQKSESVFVEKFLKGK